MLLFLGFTILLHTYIDTTFIFQCQTRSITLTSHLEDEALSSFALFHNAHTLCLYPLNFIYANTCIVFK